MRPVWSFEQTIKMARKVRDSMVAKGLTDAAAEADEAINFVEDHARVFLLAYPKNILTGVDTD